MDRKGLFGPFIVLILLGLLVFVWAVILPEITPLITGTINETSDGPHADGVGFFLRMIPWAVPVIIILGFLWLMVRG